MYREALSPTPLVTRINHLSRTKQLINLAAAVKWQQINSPALRELKKKGLVGPS
jgi:hypothetical protein